MSTQFSRPRLILLLLLALMSVGVSWVWAAPAQALRLSKRSLAPLPFLSFSPIWRR